MIPGNRLVAVLVAVQRGLDVAEVIGEGFHLGAVDELFIYSRSLLVSEIEALYSNGLQQSLNDC